MKSSSFRCISWLLILHLFLGTLPLIAQEAATAAKSAAGDAIDRTLNYDYKSFAGKLLYERISEDVKAGRPIDWEKLKQEFSSKGFLTNVGIAGGAEVTGTLIQLGMTGVAPPFGLIVGSVISAVLNAGGGAIGYEAYAAMKSGDDLTAKEILGQALSNIDMPEFIGRTIGSTAGAAIGQALIPIPVVGMVLGGIVGGVAGSMVVNALRKIPAVSSWFDSIQEQWKKVGESLKKPKTAAELAAMDGPPAITDPKTVETTADKLPAQPPADQHITGSTSPFAENQQILINPGQ